MTYVLLGGVCLFGTSTELLLSTGKERRAAYYTPYSLHNINFKQTQKYKFKEGWVPTCRNLVPIISYHLGLESEIEKEHSNRK